MQSVSQLVWGPWLVFGVPLVGLLVWLATRGAAAQDNRRSSAEAERAYRNQIIASAAGMGGIGGVALAIELGGPGAVAWMWGTLLLGAGLNLGQARLAGQAAGSPTPRFATALTGLLTILVALTAGSAFQAQQLGALWQQASGMPAWSAAFVLTAAAAPALLFPAVRGRLFAAAPMIVGVYLLGCALIILQDTLGAAWALGHIAEHALDYEPLGGGVAGAGLTVAMAHGAARAVMVGELGLGVSGRAVTAEVPPARAGRIAATVAIAVGAVVSTATAIVVLLGPASSEPVTERVVVPMEVHMSRGLRPSADVGQTIVLPPDTALESGNAYPMVLRANPRGNLFSMAQLQNDENVIVVPALQVLEGIDTVVFRPDDKRLAANPGWDVRVPVNAEPFEPQPGHKYLKLTPVDPELQFRRLIVRRRLDKTVYLVGNDFNFSGQVSKAMSPVVGEHLAMFELREEGAPINPKLHEFFRMGYRGPYFRDNLPRPPFALVGAQNLDTSAGDLLELELRSPERGANLLLVDKLGATEAPPWDFLQPASRVVLRHVEDASRDIFVPVRSHFEEGRLHFVSTDPAFADFRVVEKMEEFTGPYLVAPPFRFTTETRTDTRLPAEWAGRAALVAHHDLGEPTGPSGEGMYTPHPGEVIATDLLGPFPAQGQGAAVVAARFAERFGPVGRLWIVLAAVALCAASITAWNVWASQVAPTLLVAAGSVAALFVGAGLESGVALAAADICIGALALVGMVGLLARLRRLRS